MLQNHLKGLLKHTLLGLILRVSDSYVGGGDRETVFLTSIAGDKAVSLKIGGLSSEQWEIGSRKYNGLEEGDTGLEETNSSPSVSKGGLN